MKKVLVTGGRGFIGKRLLEVLSCDESIQVLTVGRNQSEDVSIDLSDSKLLEVLKDFKPNIVCHFASGSNIKRAEENKEKEYQSVVLNTKKILDALKELKAEKFIYLSSQAVYGDPSSLPADEDCKLNPDSYYGKCKKEAEELIKESGINYSILRISSIYGPGQDFSKSGVVAKFINKLSNNEQPVIFNSFESFIDLIYIEDVVSAILKLIRSENCKKSTYNLASGKKHTLKDILYELYNYYPNAPKPRLEINDVYKNNKFNGLYLNTNKINNELNWSCKYNLKEGIKELFSKDVKV